MNSLNVILGPIISEKSMTDAASGKYTFKVSVESTKPEIKKAIEEQFKVNVLKVATITVKGRSSKTGIRRVESLKQPFKKAIALLKVGQKISIFDSGAQK
jgi:large subunit ribosomal protein L23